MTTPTDPRVEPSDVAKIIDFPESDMGPYIGMAHTVVQANLKALKKCGLTDSELFELERWLSAHFMSTAGKESSGGQKGNLVMEKEDSLQRQYGGQFGKFLEASGYGQHALILDRCGVLAGIGKRRAFWEVS